MYRAQLCAAIHRHLPWTGSSPFLLYALPYVQRDVIEAIGKNLIVPCLSVTCVTSSSLLDALSSV